MWRRAAALGGLSRALSARAARPAFEELKRVLTPKINHVRHEMTEIKRQCGAETLGGITVSSVRPHTHNALPLCLVGQLMSGLRGVVGLLYEPSVLDQHHGIKYRGHSIPDCQQLLPRSPAGGEEVCPEAVLWLLLTGDIPTAEQLGLLVTELRDRAAGDEGALAISEMKTAVRALPRNLHPMTMYISAVLALQRDSVFARSYLEGVRKADLWMSALDDSLNVVARSVHAAAAVYRHAFFDETVSEPEQAEGDLACRFGWMLGLGDDQFADLLRLYLSVHADHEGLASPRRGRTAELAGGNVSAHSTTLVGSALSDPYLAWNPPLLPHIHIDKNGQQRRDNHIPPPKDEDEEKELLTSLIWQHLHEGKVVPGYGHAVLRVTDPRYTVQSEFAQRHGLERDRLVKLVGLLHEVVPRVLKEHGRVSNPYPNVDAHSGVLLHAYGLPEQDFYTVMFGVSRGLGVLSALVWDRALLRPIERVKSVPSEELVRRFGPMLAPPEEPQHHQPRR